MKLRAATRGSPLAMWQTNHIATLLEQQGFQVEPVIVQTSGDKDQKSPLHEIGGQGIFVKEVQSFVIQERADFAVHSLKDLPSDIPSGLVLAAVPDRGDPRDALVGSTLKDLEPKAKVATGSIRRKSQLAEIRPDISFHELRGNIHTRLEKAKSFDIDKVHAAHPNIELPDAPEGYVRVHETNQHLYSRAKIGKITRDGQFEVIAISKDLIEPDPFPKGYQ